MKLLIAYGTRPEYIKVKSLLKYLPKYSIDITSLMIAQHTDLLESVPEAHRNLVLRFPDWSSNLFNQNRLNQITASIMTHPIWNKILELGITHVMVQGDTTLAMAVAMTAFNFGLKVIHLEAGLRTYDIDNPFPEELNRQVISRLASYHFCPTYANSHNLESELGSQFNILRLYVVGNTGLDDLSVKREDCYYGNTVLITLHRRDNHPMMKEWFEQIRQLALGYPELEFIFPMHPNPNVQKWRNVLENDQPTNLTLTSPKTRDETLTIIAKCRFVISDSGGIQEECCFINKKFIVCPIDTERPESVGIHSILCPKPSKLSRVVESIYDNYVINAKCPYGDGKAWEHIKDIIISKIKK